MWLLRTDTLELEYFVDERATPYCILSHTWGQEEVAYQEIRGAYPKSKAGYLKIQQTCRQAVKDGYKHVWIDTCCINKESSAELSEAINSMFEYYAKAAVCYVYLEDVWVDTYTILLVKLGNLPPEHALGLLKSSRWFTRGWTLQELVAPRSVRFFGRSAEDHGHSWQFLGTRQGMSETLETLTRIDRTLLENRPGVTLDTFTIAARMSWAANRQTTRREDQAYSLLGIFHINMPLLYGEGDSAFQRLQEEIIRRTDDLSILAWACSRSAKAPCALLAPSPDSFADLSRVVRWRTAPASRLRLTNVALEADLPVSGPIAGILGNRTFLVVLNCHHKDNLLGPLALCAVLNEEGSSYQIQTHRGRHGDDVRVKVVPFDLIVAAPVQRCNLQPRFSNHRHWLEYPALRFEQNGPGIQRIWIKLPTSEDHELPFTKGKNYGFKLTRAKPRELWSDTGLFCLSPAARNIWPQGEDLMDGSGPTEVYAECTYAFNYPVGHTEDVDDAIISKKRTVRIDLRLDFCPVKKRFEIASIRLTEMTAPFGRRLRPYGLGMIRFAQRDWIPLDDSTCLEVELKKDQKIMDHIVDVIAISVTEKDCRPELGSDSIVVDDGDDACAGAGVELHFAEIGLGATIEEVDWDTDNENLVESPVLPAQFGSEAKDGASG